MSIENTSPHADRAAAEFTLKPARIDLSTTKTQMVVGAIICVIACFAAYWQSLGTGFLLDDFLHIDYVARAKAGVWEPFISNFTGNWAGSDIMKSYRPVTSVSLLCDYFLWGTWAAGFHLTNVLLLCGCALFVGLITLELTGLWGNRLGAVPALWAALLFAVYPLHPEAAAWIIGRVDLLSTFFYLASVFLYLRFRLIKEQSYLWASLAAFAISLLSKEMAVTLPAVITAAELSLWREPKTTASSPDLRERRTQRLLYVGFFWATLCFLATLRFVLLGVIIGGYSSANGGPDLHAFSNFFDKASLLKILFPANEEIQIFNWLKPALTISYALALACLGVRLILRSGGYGVYIFLILWTVLSAAPAYQIWHIYPNLVGSRLFFLSSAPLSIFLALAALPAIGILKRSYTLAAGRIAVLSLSSIFIIWSLMLNANLKPWVEASKQMSGLESQVADVLGHLSDNQRALFVDLPTDYKGAGMLTRPQYLQILARQPFSAKDETAHLLTIEPPVTGSHDFIWPRRFKDMLLDKSVTKTLVWDRTSQRFLPKAATLGQERYDFEATKQNAARTSVEPKDALLSSADKWKVLSENASCITAYPNFMRVFPGKQAVTVYLPDVNIDPLKGNVLSANIDFQSNTGCHGCYGGKLKIVFDGLDNSNNPVHGEATIKDGKFGRFLVWLGRYRKWTLSRQITRLGVRCEPGEYFADLHSVTVISDKAIVPASSLCLGSSGEKLSLSDQVRLGKDSSLQIEYDVSKIPQSVGVQLVITKPGTTFDASGEKDIQSIDPPSGDIVSLMEALRKDTKGKIALPPEIYRSPGLHQIRVNALDEDENIIGLPGEPITVFSKNDSDSPGPAGSAK